ncbi:MAG: glutaminyl-peptide cyclotransferase [Candidatus Electrothrix communis]|nr:MAG: glutaminyl-peptide cyclotransferase [Candidatus Electrothrix communis]
MRVLLSILSFLLLLFGASSIYGETEIPRPEQYTYTLIRKYYHDPKAFTQGLAWDEGRMYEGTGLYGRSSLRSVDLETGLVNRERRYRQKYFAEGITVFQGRIYQLTWKSRRIFQFDKDKFSVIRSLPYPREGWGITHNGKELIVSDGTASLYFLDPETLEEKRRILVRDDQGEVARLNELEYVRGAIYANVWQTDRIAIIRPQDGAVSGWLDLSELSARVQSIWKGKTDVLNGIMYDPVNDRLFVTGKLWPSLFEIKVVPTEGL